MPKFSANLSLLFTEYDLLTRFSKAREFGFNAVEIQFPYSLDPEQILKALQANQLKLVLFNVDADDLLQGGEGLASVPEKQDQFISVLNQAKIYAEILRPEAINVLPGRCFNKKRTKDYLATLHQNLNLALKTFNPLGVKTVFEAINIHDMPGSLVSTSQQMLEIIAEHEPDGLAMQYDIYHMQMMQEDIVSFLTHHWNKIGHIQFADVPGRHQPGNGHIDFQSLFTFIDKLGYKHWLGAEYIPTDSTQSSLQWMSQHK